MKCSRAYLFAYFIASDARDEEMCTRPTPIYRVFEHNRGNVGTCSLHSSCMGLAVIRIHVMYVGAIGRALHEKITPTVAAQRSCKSL